MVRESLYPGFSLPASGSFSFLSPVLLSPVSVPLKLFDPDLDIIVEHPGNFSRRLQEFVSFWLFDDVDVNSQINLCPQF